MNLIDDYTSTVLPLKNDYEGEVKAVLTSCNHNTRNRKSVLYLHGFVDYFFHPHLGESFNKNGYDFYALDLRKYGRSLMPHQHPNYCRNINEYFDEISISIQKIKENDCPLYLLAHSTGGLTASCYMNSGERKSDIDGVILNSPFLDFNQSKLEKIITPIFAGIMSKISSYSKIEGALSPAYAQSIHKDYFGLWDFNLEWKPIHGFPTYFIWIKAISEAQKSLSNSNIRVPILILHSSGSLKLKKYSKEAMSNDIVLNIHDIIRVGQKLGNQVTLKRINNAQHDVFLSSHKVREKAFSAMFKWLENVH
jgi:alpha-beta hydrolase superfamily lysophospholipase